MIQVHLFKRKKRKKKRNGQHEIVWLLGWQTEEGWKQESTGTADRVKAESLRVAKMEELNAPDAPANRKAATWEECREALKRAMEADNLLPSYVADALLMFDKFGEVFTGIDTPARITPAHANEYKRLRGDLSPWTVKGDLSTLRAVFGKWLGRELGLLTSNPFANAKPPRCDEPDIRIVTGDESKALFDWLTLSGAAGVYPLSTCTLPRLSAGEQRKLPA